MDGEVDNGLSLEHELFQVRLQSQGVLAGDCAAWQYHRFTCGHSLTPDFQVVRDSLGDLSGAAPTGCQFTTKGRERVPSPNGKRRSRPLRAEGAAGVIMLPANTSAPGGNRPSVAYEL